MGSLKLGCFRALSARLLYKLEHVGFSLPIMSEDVVKVRAEFDCPFRGVIQWTEAVDELPERLKVFVHLPLRRRFVKKGRFVFAELKNAIKPSFTTVIFN